MGYESFVDECSSLLTARFSELALSHQTINMGHWLQFYAFDVVGYITFGKRFGFLDTGEDKTGILQAIEDRSAYCTFIGIYPFLHKYIFPRPPKTGAYGYLFQFSQDSLAARERALKDPHDTTHEGPPDFMSKLFSAHSADPKKITRDDLLAIATSNIGAGSDTTAITLSAIFYYLLKNPSTYHRLQTEIDTAAKEGRLSDPVTFKEGQDLRYLQAVVKEALRRHPATGLPMGRTVLLGGTTLVGRTFPPGSVVGINSWVAHHNQSVYGPDADNWRPERWLEIEEQGRGGEIEKYSMAFGLGSRTCIGKNISLLEMSKLVPQLLRRFNFVLDESLRSRGWTLSNRWFVKPVDFKGRVVLREKK
jgi:cytochrome P450